ncbi:MAG: hypothetical protein ACJAZB_000758 [Psychrosphaera sp.]|jgi:hypothetical protein
MKNYILILLLLISANLHSDTLSTPNCGYSENICLTQLVQTIEQNLKVVSKKSGVTASELSNLNSEVKVMASDINSLKDNLDKLENNSWNWYTSAIEILTFVFATVLGFGGIYILQERHYIKKKIELEEVEIKRLTQKFSEEGNLAISKIQSTIDELEERKKLVITELSIMEYTSKINSILNSKSIDEDLIYPLFEFIANHPSYENIVLLAKSASNSELSKELREDLTRWSATMKIKLS